MTFFGHNVKVGANPTPISCTSGDLVHLSAIILSGSPVAGEHYLFKVTDENGKTFAAATLSAQQPQQALDLFLTQGTMVSLVGKGKNVEADITGYTEPMGSGMDSSSEESEAEDETNEAGMDSLKQAIAQFINKKDEKTTTDEEVSGAEEDSDDESEMGDKAGSDDDDSDDNEGSDDDEEDAEDDDDESDVEETTAGGEAAKDSSDEESSSEEEVVEEKPPVKASKKQQEQLSKKDDKKPSKMVQKPKVVENKKEDKKRKASSQPEGAPAAKKPAGPEAEYESAIVSFLKQTGNSAKISAIGARVKRPASLKVKLGAFLKERPIFNVIGDSVTLKD